MALDVFAYVGQMNLPVFPKAALRAHCMCPTERSSFQDTFSLSQFQPIILIKTPFIMQIISSLCQCFNFLLTRCLAKI